MVRLVRLELTRTRHGLLRPAWLPITPQAHYLYNNSIYLCCQVFLVGGHGRTRTFDPRFRKPVLYPAELRDQISERDGCRPPFQRPGSQGCEFCDPLGALYSPVLDIAAPLYGKNTLYPCNLRCLSNSIVLLIGQQSLAKVYDVSLHANDWLYKDTSCTKILHSQDGIQ